MFIGYHYKCNFIWDFWNCGANVHHSVKAVEEYSLNMSIIIKGNNQNTMDENWARENLWSHKQKSCAVTKPGEKIYSFQFLFLWEKFV